MNIKKLYDHKKDIIRPYLKHSKILCLTASGNGFGTGHFRRMQYVQKELEKKMVSMDICTNLRETSKRILDYSIILLDKRDDSFPDFILKQYPDIKKIVLDNKGMGREQADVIWDTLPHPEMNIHQFKNSLRKMILPEHITKKSSKANLSKIHYSHSILFNKSSTKKKALHLKVKEEVYFGQKLFEAIYMGKEIQLYNIGTYHRYLSTYFMNIWKNLKHPNLYLDGNGRNRLAEYILDLL